MSRPIEGGPWFVVMNENGQYLRAFFADVPDWCALMSNARRYCAQAAKVAVDRARAAGDPCTALGLLVNGQRP